MGHAREPPGSVTKQSPSMQPLSSISPTLTMSLYLATTLLPRLLSTTTLFLLLRVYILSHLILLHSYYTLAILAIQSYYASVVLLRQGWWLSKGGARWAWRGSGGLRKKLWFEFATFVLGNGNGILLIVFWPGWIVVGGVVWVGGYCIG
ncbi:hypothetical protein BJ875DRAFT_58687 [Amylocarpus encephaloides]|uniref:Uncharacterized protein n=1 Tax=Amylocarpus encephaloides TaxID=45428 RepID=A0A9P8C4F6_9HELO|nr:hypothetical protein BJ875DRAFT_58687 [Amylocarpus encephaloides]